MRDIEELQELIADEIEREYREYIQEVLDQWN